VFLGDGAAWIWELARVNFPDAVQILDLRCLLMSNLWDPCWNRLHNSGHLNPQAAA